MKLVSMFRNYLLQNNFWAKKGADCNVYMRHDSANGGIYASIKTDPRGVEITVNGEKQFFNNFDELDGFLANIDHSRNEFQRILTRKSISRKLRTLEI